MAGRGQVWERSGSDWIVVAVLVVTLWLTGIARLFTGTDPSAQRAAMSGCASIFGTISAFTVASLFFYAGLDNPTTRRVQEVWRGYLAGVFLRSLLCVVAGALVCAIGQVGASHYAATLVFFVAAVTALVKLARIVLTVSLLLDAKIRDNTALPRLRARDSPPE